MATVTNQFLKGLADVTGLSFSLLIGGPSIKLGGMIDVWRYVCSTLEMQKLESQNDTHLRSFHVRMMKLGNNFSQAYPKFESDIVGPF
jgi:hypothetical protein